MPLLPLDNLVRIGQLKIEPPAQAELDAGQWRVLDQAHRKRNLAEYEGDLDVDEALVQALIRTTQTVAGRIAALGRLKS